MKGTVWARHNRWATNGSTVGGPIKKTKLEISQRMVKECRGWVGELALSRESREACEKLVLWFESVSKDCGHECLIGV